MTMLSDILSDLRAERALTQDDLEAAGAGERLREPERSRIAEQRRYDHEQYLNHGADWSEDFNRLVYRPMSGDAPDEDDLQHGSGIGALFCGCRACHNVRRLVDLNGWVILPHVRLIRRPAKAAELRYYEGLIGDEKVGPAWADRLRAEMESA